MLHRPQDFLFKRQRANYTEWVSHGMSDYPIIVLIVSYKTTNNENMSRVYNVCIFQIIYVIPYIILLQVVKYY